MQKDNPQQNKTPLQTISVKFDAAEGRLSHILKLKEIFSEHHGTTPVNIVFVEGERPLATLQIESRWGVTLTPKLKERLKSIPSVVLEE